MSENFDAVVVGSGPNGLAAAITLAQAGLRVGVFEAAAHFGGGSATAELTLPGFRHDLCSAVHPLAAASPFFRTLGLERFGLEWIVPPAAAAHPLEDGAALLYPSVEETAAGLGGDGAAYRTAFAHLAEKWEALFPEILGPPIRVPKHPLLLARFGAVALFPAADFARFAFRGERARALFAGIGAHANAPLEKAGTSAIGAMLLLAAHARNWPIPKGGAGAISTALVRCLESLGGSVHVGRRITKREELPPARVTLFDLMPGAAHRILGTRHPPAYPHGHGVFKVDWALSAPIPWRDPAVAKAATVHLGGSLAKIAAAERAPEEGRCADAPYVLLSQPTLFDPSRAPTGKHIAWAYCHVPAGSTLDRTDAIERQIERFAPGFRDLVLARAKQNTSELEARNANYVGGDINAGAFSLPRLLFRPRFGVDPYALPEPGNFLCSAATPPGPGVHGMAGYHAGMSALRFLRRHRKNAS